MKSLKVLLLLMSITTLQFCTSSRDNTTFWVSGLRSECTSTVVDGDCYNIYKGKDIKNAEWQNFNSIIEGFKFEKGVNQKIEVKAEKSPNRNLQNNETPIKYTLVKVLATQDDKRIQLEGKWVLARLNDAPINRSIVLPTLNIALDRLRISGFGGCNNYSGQIDNLNNTAINFNGVVSTKKACINNNIEDKYLLALNAVKAFILQGDKLVFKNEDAGTLLSFIKHNELPAKNRLHDIWIAERINGLPLNKGDVNPRLEINLTEMKAYGNDGCNEYSGDITEASDDKLSFGPLAATKKMCHQLGVTNPYYDAMSKAIGFKIKGLNLILLDSDGEEVLSFVKGD